RFQSGRNSPRASRRRRRYESRGGSGSESRRARGQGTRVDRPAVQDADPEIDGPARGAGPVADGSPRSGADQDSAAGKTGLGRPPSRYALRWTTFAWLANRSSRVLASVSEGWATGLKRCRKPKSRASSSAIGCRKAASSPSSGRSVTDSTERPSG